VAAEQALLRRGRLQAGDVLAVVAGTQMASGSTNFMRLHVVTAEGAGTLPVPGLPKKKRRGTRKTNA
jgi:hypothetical protein